MLNLHLFDTKYQGLTIAPKQTAETRLLEDKSSKIYRLNQTINSNVQHVPSAPMPAKVKVQEPTGALTSVINRFFQSLFLKADPKSSAQISAAKNLNLDGKKTREKKELPNETEKKIGSAINEIRFIKVAEGKAKKVWVADEKSLKELKEVNPVLYGDLSKTAFYTPTDQDLQTMLESAKTDKKVETDKEKEIKYEVALANKISTRLLDLRNEKNQPVFAEAADLNIAVNLQVVGEKAGPFTVKTERAKCDLEGAIQNKELTMVQRARLLKGAVIGLNQLHSTGVCAGDLKPENFLVFDAKTLGRKQSEGKASDIAKLSDLGKAKELGEQGSSIYTGNPRFGPPESTLSQKGDVYGMAMVLIRGLEEEILSAPKNANKRCLFDDDQIANKKKEHLPNDKRRGIEYFRIMDGRSNAIETSHLSGLTRYYVEGNRRLSSMISSGKSEESAMHQYVGKLKQELTELHPEDQVAIGELCTLLKSMLNADPAARPNMDQVGKSYMEFLKQVDV